MAKIIENLHGRRIIEVSTDDIFSIVREYQQISSNINKYDLLRETLDKTKLYLPEDL